MEMTAVSAAASAWRIGSTTLAMTLGLTARITMSQSPTTWAALVAAFAPNVSVAAASRMESMSNALMREPSTPPWRTMPVAMPCAIAPKPMKPMVGASPATVAAVFFSTAMMSPLIPLIYLIYSTRIAGSMHVRLCSLAMLPSLPCSGCRTLRQIPARSPRSIASL